MYCYCKIKNRRPSFENFKELLGIGAEEENADEQNEAEVRGCRVKSAKGPCE